MKVGEVMNRNVITVMPGHSIHHAARIMLEQRISGLPVVDAGVVVGIISEGDLLRRVEFGQPKTPGANWDRATSPEGVARDYVRSHSWKVADVMSKAPATATEDMDLADAAALMAARGIKRLPVIRDGRLVGLVSRADFLQVIASAPTETQAQGDQAIELAARTRLSEIGPMLSSPPSVIVSNGVLHL
ncbi:MAG: CBS domain-containing protein, partial [Devosia sp.]